MKKSFLFSLLLCLPLFAISQILPAGQCGTQTTQEDINRLLENKKFVKEFGIVKNNLTTLIPLKLHLVGRNDGSGRISELRAMEGICKLNEHFAPLDMHFHLYDGFNYIDNTQMFDLQYPNVPFQVLTLYQTQKAQNAVNIFIGNGLSTGNSGYYTGAYDIIYMDKTYVNDDDGILAHEMGHFFSLAHTFYGWENTTYDPDSPTPQTVYWSNGNGNAVEYVDRDVNCETSGDFICDTPADYITSWGGGCNYTGGAVDPDEVLIDPDEANHMAYFSFAGCTEYHYSEEQMETIMGDYLSRPALTIPNPPQEVLITEVANLVSPIETVEENYTEVTFTWDPVPNATKYIIQIAPLQVFSAILHDYAIVSENTYTSTMLNPGRENYYWRVLAYSEYDFCNPQSSATGHFSTGEMSTNTIEIAANLEAKIFPNPITDQHFLIELNQVQSSELQIQITDIQGRLVWSSIQERIAAGTHQIPMQADLKPGLYLVQLRGDWGLKTLKLAVQ